MQPFSASKTTAPTRFVPRQRLRAGGSSTMAKSGTLTSAPEHEVLVSGLEPIANSMEYDKANARQVTVGALFEICNQCSYTVWAAASPGGGTRLDPFQSWTINVPAGTVMARIWGRTNCNFDGSGRGGCETGDCDGLLQCQGWGAPPNTLAEFALNQFQNLDFYDMSLVDGYEARGRL
ncbi:hypothetical protein V6N11_019938 [Hibiscus sabdariffa]|uniref:Uncharacterized protein n=1 Tax=Hibiscus sabdariffa TaxID=183260 RepID=A0ABR1ZKB1_9ROSI